MLTHCFVLRTFCYVRYFIIYYHFTDIILLLMISVVQLYSDSKINPPLMGPNGVLIPLRNNAAGKGTGLKVVMNNMSDEFFPNDNRRRGFNVSTYLNTL